MLFGFYGVAFSKSYLYMQVAVGYLHGGNAEPIEKSLFSPLSDSANGMFRRTISAAFGKSLYVPSNLVCYDLRRCIYRLPDNPLSILVHLGKFFFIFFHAFHSKPCHHATASYTHS